MEAANTGGLNSVRTAKRNGMLYPLMLIAAIAVILFSVIGIAAMTGLLPGAQSKSEPQSVVDTRRTTPQTAGGSVAAPQARSRASAGGAACAECGVVESVRAVESAAPASGLGAVAGGVLGGIVGNQVGGGRGRTAMTVVGAGAGAYAGHEVEKNMNRSVSYQVRVRMSDGSVRNFSEPAKPSLSAGQKVRVTDGRLIAAE